MQIHEFRRLTTRQNKDVVAFYGLRRSGTIKTIQSGQDCVFEDDGIREKDLEPIAHLSFDDVVALKPVGSVAVADPEDEPEEIFDEPVAEPEAVIKPKRRKKSK